MLRAASTRIYCSANFNENNNAANTKEVIGDNALLVVDDIMREVEGRPRLSPPDNLHEDFRNFLSHPIKISHTDWTPATAYSITLDIVAAWKAAFPTLFLEKTKNFLMFKGDLKITVVVQGMPMAAGQMVLSFTPNVKTPHVGAPYARANFANYVNAKIVPHLVLDPSKTSTYELILPVCTPNGWYSFLQNYDHGSYAMEFFPFNELISGTDTAPSASICVYLSMDNPQFEGLTTTLLSNDFVVEKKKGTWSQFMAKASDTATTLAKVVPVFSPQITLFSEVTGALGSVLSWFGYSKPPLLDNDAFVLNRTCDNYSQKDGKSTSIVLGGSQTTGVGLSPSYGLGTLDEMTIAHIINKKGLVVLNGVIPVDLAKESAIQTLVLSPTLTVDVGVTTSTYWNPLSGVAMMFDYWVGDFIVEIEFIASVFHRATVLICWDPNSDVFASPVVFSDALTLLKNTTVNISGNTSVEIRVPYKQAIPWSRVDDPTSGDYTGTSNGRLVMFLINPVTTNGSTDGIHYNMYWRSDNMRFSCPNAEKITLRSVPASLLSNDFVPSTPIEFGPRTNLDLAHFRSFGDQVNSVKELSSRMGVCFSTPLFAPPSATETRLTSYIQNLPPRRGPSSYRTTLFSWISTAYLGYRGGIRWSWETNAAQSDSLKLRGVRVANSSSDVYTSNLLPVVSWKSETSEQQIVMRQYAWTEPNLLVSSRADIVAPMLLPLDYAPTRYFVTGYENTVMIEAPVYQVGGGEDPVAMTTLATGSADDGAFCWFLGFQATI